MEMLAHCLMRKGTQVPVIVGVLEAVEKSSLGLDWAGVGGYSPSYRLRVDGEYYFVVPLELSLLSSGESKVRQLRNRERIVLAYRGEPSGRRVVAWAFQAQVSLNPWGDDPRDSLRTDLTLMFAGMVSLVCACTAFHSFMSNFSVGLLVLGVLLGIVAMLLLGIALFSLRDLRGKHRFSYHQANQDAMIWYSDAAEEGIDGL